MSITANLKKGQQWWWSLKEAMHCSCSFLANICIGYAMGYSSVAIEQLEKEFGTDVLDVHAKSWIGSLLDLGLTIGAPVGGGLSNWLSLRNCNLIMSPLVMLSWALIGGSNKAHLYFIFIGRIISGVGAGFYTPVNLTYLSHSTSKENRAIITAMAPLFTCIGIFISYLVGILASWRIAAFFGSCLPLLVMLTAPLMKTAPSDSVPNTTSNKIKLSLPTDSKKLQIFQSRKPFLILMVIFLLQSFTGANAMTYYASNILAGLLEQQSLKNAGTLIIGMSFVIGYVIGTSFFLKRFPRRTLMILSSILMALSSAMVAVIELANLNSTYFGMSGTLLCLMVFLLSYCSGFGPIPFIFVGEFFPLKVAGFLSGIIMALKNIFCLIAVKTFPYMLELTGMASTFLFSSIVCLAGAFFTFLFVPETKDLSQEQLLQIFRKKKDNQSNSTDVMV